MASMETTIALVDLVNSTARFGPSYRSFEPNEPESVKLNENSDEDEEQYAHNNGSRTGQEEEEEAEEWEQEYANIPIPWSTMLDPEVNISNHIANLDNDEMCTQIAKMEQELVDPRQRGPAGDTDTDPLRERDHFVPLVLKRLMGPESTEGEYKDQMKGLNVFQATGHHNLLLLNHFAETRGVITNTSAEGCVYMYSMHRIMAVFKAACQTLIHQNTMSHLLNPAETHESLKTYVPVFHYAMFDAATASPYQRCLDRMSSYFQQHNIRRSKEQCFSEIEVIIGTDHDNHKRFAELPTDLDRAVNRTTNAGRRRIAQHISSTYPLVERFQTRAWRQTCTITEIIYMIFKQDETELWLDFTSAQNMAVPLANYFALCEDSRVPHLARDRFKRTFRDGLLNVEMSDDPGIKQNEKPMTVYYSPNHWDRHTPASFVACKYFDAPLSPHIVSYTHWWFIPTPHISRTYDHQRLSVTVQCAFMAQKGKLQVPLNRHDHWETILVVIGVAMAGKSVNGNAAKNLYEPCDVGIIANKMEALFGLSPLCHTFLNICFEVRSDFSMPETTLQCIASGEDIGVPVKNKEAMMVHWDVPMMLLGNALAAWSDIGGSIVRRIFLVDYKFKVKEVDTGLSKKIDNNMGNIVWKERSAYDGLCRYSKGQSLWKCIPNYFLDHQKRTAVATNPIVAFLTTSNLIYFDPNNKGYYMGFSEFRTALRSYCSTDGSGYKNNVLSPATIETNLRAQMCEILHASEAASDPRFDTHDAMPLPFDDRVILGVCLRPTYDAYVQAKEEKRLQAQQDANPIDVGVAIQISDRCLFESLIKNSDQALVAGNNNHADGQASAPDTMDDNSAVWLHREFEPQSYGTNFKLGRSGTVVLNEMAGFFSKIDLPTKNHFAERLIQHNVVLNPKMDALVRKYNAAIHSR
jgi:hypothetical protein